MIAFWTSYLEFASEASGSSAPCPDVGDGGGVWDLWVSSSRWLGIFCLVRVRCLRVFRLRECLRLLRLALVPLVVMCS